jgi:diadenosine tetraphosphate (Ap4A) HIT family hydrolase
VAEPFELAHVDGSAFWRESMTVAGALYDLLRPRKMNYEIHGNTIPHLHVHLFPRYQGDPFEDGPIDPRLIQESPYTAGEFENFKHRLQERLSKG